MSRDKGNGRWQRWTAGALACGGLVSLLMVSGCDMQNCQEVQRDYDQAVGQQSGLVDLEDSGPPHLAMALRMDFVNDISTRLIDGAIGDSLGGSTALSLGGGQSAGVTLGASGASLQMEASDACNGCLRVFGDLDGDVGVELPVVGNQSTSMSGSMDWVVPLDVRPHGDEVGLFLDTEEAARMGAPVVTTRLPGLSSSWAEPVATALADELADRIASRVDPIRLLSYGLPSFGIDGLEVTPSLFSLSEADNALVLGLRTNADVATGSHGPEAFVEALSLEGGQNVALGVQPGLVTEVVRHGLRGGRIADRYSLSGQARRDGSNRVVVDGFNAGPHESDADAVGLDLDFRLFNYDSTLSCYSAGALGQTRLAISDGNLELDVENVEFSGASAISDVANWASADFFEESRSVLSRSLDDEVIESEGLGVSLNGDRVNTSAGMVVMRAFGSSS